MRTVTLHDTLTGAIRELTPETPPRVRIYACGPTVYGRVHVGNARPFVVFSLLKRFLAHEGYEPVFVANITDINDKIYVAARQAGIPSELLAEQMTAAYQADTDVFGLGRPDHEPLASETIAGIVALIEELVERGHAYAADGDVYFAVRSYPEYGELSHRHIDQMDQGDELEGAARKRDPVDFALWKGHKETEDTSWDSPWGPGRPGWHIECSAMAEELLGVGFEVHGGGSDLIFPHHENEAAQSRAARGHELARLWMHVGMVRLDREKMSKSVGNVFMLGEALERHGPETLLMYFCSAHYHQPMEYDEDRLAEARKRGQRHPQHRPRARRRAQSGVVGAAARSGSSTLSPTTSTPHGRWRSSPNGNARPTGGRPGPSGTAICGRCSTCSASPACSTTAARPSPMRRPPCCRRVSGPGVTGTGRRPTGSATSSQALGWEVRDGPDGPELVPSG